MIGREQGRGPGRSEAGARVVFGAAATIAAGIAILVFHHERPAVSVSDARPPPTASRPSDRSRP